MLGIHLQKSFTEWLDVVRLLPKHTPILAIDQGNLLRDAKQVNSGIVTILRHWYDNQQHFDGSSYPVLLDRARSFFRSFLDDTFAQQYAAHVDVVKTWNETLANSQTAEERQWRVDQDRAFCEVWAADYQARWPHMRLALASAAVGNDIPLGSAKLAAQYGHYLSYHSYLFMKGGQVQDNEYLAYRWQTMDAEYRQNGVYVKWVSTEAGPFESAITGWRDAQCCANVLERYHDVMRDYARRCAEWNSANGNRFRGAVLFTSFNATDGQWALFHTAEREWPRLAAISRDYAIGDVTATPPPPEPEPEPIPEPAPAGAAQRLQVIAPAGLLIRTAKGEAVGALPVETRFYGVRLANGRYALRGSVSGDAEHVRLVTDEPAPPPVIPPAPVQLPGVDVSVWQGEIDWRLMQEQGVKIAGIKVSEGTGHVDARWRDNHRWARAYGIKVFPYHYFRNDQNAEEQAAHFRGQYESVTWDYPPAGDFEDTRTGVLDLAHRIRLFLETSGTRIVYTSPGWWNARVGAQDWADDYLLWVAHWEVIKPQLPAGWDTWWGWQHTITDDAEKYGVESARLDLDWFKTQSATTALFWPVASRALSRGGNTWGNPAGHEAVDLAASEGDPVYAAASGVVKRVGFEPGGYGNYVRLQHGVDTETLYAHLATVGVQFGELVDGGQQIGTAGSTGNSTGAHLHFELMADGEMVDPWPVLQALE